MSILKPIWASAKNSLAAEFTPLVKVGTGLLFGSWMISELADDQQKESLVRRYVAIANQCINTDRVSENDIRTSLWNNYQSGVNVIASSPVFYGMYHFIHSSGLPIHQHITRAALRGITGTAATVPAFCAMYGAAALVLPAIQSKYMRFGASKEDAKSLGEATVFLGLAAPIEYAAEAIGCGVKGSQMRSRLFPLATALISLRLASGVLLQYRALDDTDKSSQRKYTDLTKSVAGTTVAQHGINATMQAMSNGTGLKGVMSYLKQGTANGNRPHLSAARQLGGTLAQRVAFVTVWNELSHRKVSPPAWAGNQCK
ncbi:MAG: hypothetical protein KGZ39_01965 [Simkania sp.]|nr:hypothetical protein [Simkania sp.]